MPPRHRGHRGCGMWQVFYWHTITYQLCFLYALRSTTHPSAHFSRNSNQHQRARPRKDSFPTPPLYYPSTRQPLFLRECCSCVIHWLARLLRASQSAGNSGMGRQQSFGDPSLTVCLLGGLCPSLLGVALWRILYAPSSRS